jgi:PAS domain S-box-containing protein
LALALLLTVAATYYVAVTAEAKDRLRFHNVVGDAEESIKNRLETYIALLRAGSGLFAASDRVSRSEFHAYIEQLELKRYYPGAQGIGFSVRVSPQAKDALIATMRQAGQANFQLQPDYPRDEYHSIIYLEPLDSRNQAAIGYDMFTEPVRRAAMERARDSGLPAASGKVTLVQEIEGPKQAGFLIYVPIYRPGQTPHTEAERRAALTGFIYSPFRADDLWQGILRAESHLALDFQVFDGDGPKAENLLHHSNSAQAANDRRSAPHFTATRKIEVAGRKWLLSFTSRPGFELASQGRFVPYVLLSGLVISFVLFSVARSQAQARAAAERAALELLESEEALRLSESRLRRLVDANIIGIVIGDFQDNIIEANDAFLSIIGYTREDLRAGAVKWAHLTPPEYRCLDIQALAEIKLRGAHPPVEKEFIRKDGTRVPVLLGTAYLPDSQDLAVSFFLDLTERKRAEEERAELLAREREARAEAERASHAKDEFVATLSHELRTPLNAILGWAHLLRSGNLKGEKAAHALETIERNAKAQAQMVDDILDISRIIQGRMRLEVRSVELTSVINAAIDAVRPAAEAKKLELRTHLDPSASLVSGDPDRLQQVIWNLLANAVKFTPSGGQVEVRLERADPHAQISVRDTGSGISPDFLPHVFDRFRQADSSSTRPYGGLGLGLSIVRHLVELQGGAVTAASDGVGRGATFTVHLPLRAVRDVQPQLPSESSSPSAVVKDKPLYSRFPRLDHLQVLVVDDEADARELLMAVLEQCGAEAIAVASAAEALEALQRWRPDVLVSDIGMPQEDGYVLIGKVRALVPEQGGRIPAIALTAYARAEDRTRALAAGFQTHVPKPVEPAELAFVIASLAGRYEKASAR